MDRDWSQSAGGGHSPSSEGHHGKGLLQPWCRMEAQDARCILGTVFDLPVGNEPEEIRAGAAGIGGGQGGGTGEKHGQGTRLGQGRNSE